MRRLLALSDSYDEHDGVGRMARAVLRVWRREHPALELELLLARDGPGKALEPGGVEPKRVLPPVAWSGAGSVRWVLEAWGGLVRVGASSAPRPDAVVSFKDYPWSWFAARLARRWDVPFVALAHGTYAVRALEDPVHGRHARAVHARARATLAVSAWTAERLRAVEPDLPRLHVVPNGIEAPARLPTDALAPPPCGDAPFLLTVAEAKERKGLHLAERVWARLAPEFPELHWVVIGSAHTGERCGEEIAAALRSAPRVHRIEFLDEPTKRAWLERARLHLFTPVVARDGAFEGFGLPFLEAAALGTPSLGTTSCGAAFHLERDLARFVAPEEETLVAALREEVQREDSPSSRAARAESALRRHGVEAGARRIWELLGGAGERA